MCAKCPLVSFDSAEQIICIRNADDSRRLQIPQFIPGIAVSLLRSYHGAFVTSEIQVRAVRRTNFARAKSPFSSTRTK